MQNNSKKLVDFINSLEGFKFDSEAGGNYQHIGATLIDGVLQAGLNYKTVVKPRVDIVLSTYPDHKTTSMFLNLCIEEGIKKIISWKDDRKPDLIMTLLLLLQKEGVETCREFTFWLNDGQNRDKLRSIKGIGPKTIDYFKILLGQESVAVDVHLKKFILLANIELSGYEEIKTLITKSANILGVKVFVLDYSIWKYMSNKQK